MKNQIQSKNYKNKDTDLDNESSVYNLGKNAEKGQMKGVNEKDTTNKIKEKTAIRRTGNGRFWRVSKKF